MANVPFPILPLAPGAIAWRGFDLLYASRLLTDGYGFGDDVAAIDFLGEIDGAEVEWTLGALHAQLASDGGAESESWAANRASLAFGAAALALAGFLLKRHGSKLGCMRRAGLHPDGYWPVGIRKLSVESV